MEEGAFYAFILSVLFLPSLNIFDSILTFTINIGILLSISKNLTVALVFYAGILSVLIQTFYNVEYLFTVDENAFNPPPKVKSSVIKLTRNDVRNLGCDYKKFVEIVKRSFSQRRKMLRNTLKGWDIPKHIQEDIDFRRRPETLSIDEFASMV